MKNFLLLFLLLVSCCPVFSQTKGNTMNVADSAGKRYLWDTQKVAQGTMMYLAVPFKMTGDDSTYNLTITVAKDRAHKRPAYIAIIIPNHIQSGEGIRIQFSKTYKDENGKPYNQMERNDPQRIPFERCNDDICTVRISGGYIMDTQTDEKTDIFEKFMQFDHVYFTWAYPDGSHKSVTLPLDSFQEQYKAIAQEDTPAWHE